MKTEISIVPTRSYKIGFVSAILIPSLNHVLVANNIHGSKMFEVVGFPIHLVAFLNERRLFTHSSLALVLTGCLLTSITAKGLRARGASLKVINRLEAVGDWRANSGCFLLVILRTSSPESFLASSELARILDMSVCLLDAPLFKPGCLAGKLEVDIERMGSSCTMAGLTPKFCECDFFNAGLIGVSACKGVGAESVLTAESTTDESGVGGNSVISFSPDLRRRSDCLLFWNQICTAFSVMLTFLAMSMRRALLGVQPIWNSRLRIASSLGDVLRRFLRANEALSMHGSRDG